MIHERREQHAGSAADVERIAPLAVEQLEDVGHAFAVRPRDARFGRALELTYVRPAGSQELAAERLGIPFGTYRYQLATGIERIARALWEREAG